MLIPSIDLMGGKIVQLVQGRELALASDDCERWIERFRRYPLVQLVDLDAALGTGNNRLLAEEFMRRLPCQVGGGVRTIGDAVRLFEAGARRVVFGSALFHDGCPDREFARSLAAALPREQLTFAIDARDDRIAVRGWRVLLDLTPRQAIRSLEDFCGAFLYTHIATEGRMCGIPLDTVRTLREATSRRLICAGGIRSQAEVAQLDALGVDAVVGMAIYTGTFDD